MLLTLLAVILALAAIAASGVVLFCLPLLWGLGTYCILTLLMGVFAKLKWPQITNLIGLLLIGATFGLSAATVRLLPHGLDVLTSVPLIFAFFCIQSYFERKFGIAKRNPLATEPHTREIDICGPRETGETDPSEIFSYKEIPDSNAITSHSTNIQTNEPLREFERWELAMSQPEVASFIFNDGAILTSVGNGYLPQDQGRYFAFPTPSNGDNQLRIYDSLLRCLYLCDARYTLGVVEHFDGDDLRCSVKWIPGAQAQHFQLNELLRDAERIDLIAIGDLFVEPDSIKHLDASEIRKHNPPKGVHQLTSRLYLPNHMHRLAEPLEPLRYPRYKLIMDFEDSKLLIKKDTAVNWNSSGTRCMCQAISLLPERPGKGTWIWEEFSGWHLLQNEPIDWNN